MKRILIFVLAFPAIAIASYYLRYATLRDFALVVVVGYALLLVPGLMTGVLDHALSRWPLAVRLPCVVLAGVLLSQAAAQFLDLSSIPNLYVYTAIAALGCGLIAAWAQKPGAQ